MKKILESDKEKKSAEETTAKETLKEVGDKSSKVNEPKSIVGVVANFFVEERTKVLDKIIASSKGSNSFGGKGSQTGSTTEEPLKAPVQPDLLTVMGK